MSSGTTIPKAAGLPEGGGRLGAGVPLRAAAHLEQALTAIHQTPPIKDQLAREGQIVSHAANIARPVTASPPQNPAAAFHTPEGDVVLRLQEAARGIGQLAEALLSRTRLGLSLDATTQTGPASTSNPTSPTLDVAQLAQAMTRNLESSGLFYESHLRDWVQGKRSTASVRREPQGQFPLTTASSSGLSETESPPPPEALQAIVKEQFHALQGEGVLIRQEAWPHQPVELWFANDAKENDAKEESGQISPKNLARIRLNTPVLGEVDIQLSLREPTLEIRVISPSQAELAAESRSLLDRLAALGLNPMLQIERPST